MAESDTSYRFEEAESHCTIVLLPELNKAPWGDIDNIGTSVVERMNAKMDASRQKPGFIVDLSALNYMGSAMVALVVRLWKASKEKGAKMVVINNDPMVLEVLELAGLSQVWTIVGTREEALRALGVVDKPQNAASPASTAAPTGTSAPVAAAEPSNVKPWMAATVLLFIATGIGVYLLSADPMLVKDMRINLGLLFGGGLLALITATVTATLGTKGMRTAGITAVVGVFALLATGVFVHPHRTKIFEGRTGDLDPDARHQGGGKTTGGNGKRQPVVAPRPGKKSKLQHQGSQKVNSKTEPPAPVGVSAGTKTAGGKSGNTAKTSGSGSATAPPPPPLKKDN